MGRQVAFYMTAADEEEVLLHLRERGDVVILPNGHARSDFPALPTLPAPGPGEDWYTVNLVPRSDLGKIRYQRVGSDRFIIDKNESPVVEWARSMQRGTKLKEGRFWMAGTPAAKTVPAVALFEDLRKWLRKNCARLERGGIFVGPDASRWVARGGQTISAQDEW